MSDISEQTGGWALRRVAWFSQLWGYQWPHLEYFRWDGGGGSQITFSSGVPERRGEVRIYFTLHPVASAISEWLQPAKDRCLTSSGYACRSLKPTRLQCCKAQTKLQSTEGNWWVIATHQIGKLDLSFMAQNYSTIPEPFWGQPPEPNLKRFLRDPKTLTWHCSAKLTARVWTKNGICLEQECRSLT